MDIDMQPTVQPTTTTAYIIPQRDYPSKITKILGSLQIVFGGTCAILQIIFIINYASFYFLGHGIWAGVLMVVAGSHGVAAAATKNRCLTIAFMVLSIIAAVFSLVVLSISAAGIPLDLDNAWETGYDNMGIKMTIASLMLIASFAKLVVAILSAVVSGKTACCTNSLDYKLRSGIPMQIISNTTDGSTMVMLNAENQQNVPYQLNGPLMIQTPDGQTGMVQQDVRNSPYPPPAYTLVPVPMVGSTSPLVSQPEYTK